jgi:4-amino-4-deoxy-L-arabinose transferase-like glycosyltransferase
MSKLKIVKTMGITALAPIAFYSVVGVLLLVLLPFANYPPHIGLTGIMSLITAYGLFTKRSWAKWLVAALFFVATTLSVYTLSYVIFSNWIVSISMIAYTVFTCVFTARTLLKKETSETEA